MFALDFFLCKIYIRVEVADYRFTDPNVKVIRKFTPFVLIEYKVNSETRNTTEKEIIHLFPWSPFIFRENYKTSI